jgi:adenylyltransferase/sulfurtransferase
VAQTGLGEIDVAQLKTILANGFDGILLDVRERDEHAWAHIEGCRLAPLSEFPSHLANLPVDQSYLVYCKVGQRSAHAAALMQEAGIRKVTNVQGGILAWLQAEGPVVKG